MFELAHADLVLDAFQQRKMALRFIRARTEALLGAGEARLLEVETIRDLEPGQFQAHPLFWRFCDWRCHEDSVEIQVKAAELAVEQRDLSIQDAIVKAIGQAIERWSKFLAREMKGKKEMQLFHPDLIEQTVGKIEENEPFQVDMEVQWVLRLAFVRVLTEWQRFHEALPSLFVSRTGLATCEAVGDDICSARPPRANREITRSSPPNEKGMLVMRRWLRLSPHQARQKVASAKAVLVAEMAAQRAL